MKNIHNSQEMRTRRQELRKSLTPEERKLWLCLRSKKLGYHFYRQHSIGPYIVDFYCPQKRLVIELDGDQHLEPENQKYDQERTNYLEYLNHKVLRFSNREVDTNIEAVVKSISSAVSLP